MEITMDMYVKFEREGAITLPGVFTDDQKYDILMEMAKRHIDTAEAKGVTVNETFALGFKEQVDGSTSVFRKPTSAEELN